ncbi:TonB-dependent receptor plug domain-containing protein [Sphingobacterium sp. SYP-B4668]|uniref:TonB-dependent receptor plug domain-containing protein n=1 Tax=Sphingobacterium sp. SYP-B4668 TaxID=2996035 RepID=UPI0022DDD8F9|nr:TonB-dependent receptor [Sphingobacterium sp. SYP-B4668]
MKSLGWVLVALCTYNTAYGRQDSAPTHYYSLLTDTTKLSEVQIQQNRLHLPFSKQSRNIQIITSEDIQKLPGSSLNEILQFANGVDIRQRGPFGSQADISIDGGSFEQTILLLNGVKMADPQTAHHALNLPIPIDAIERIEIIRGPASRIYGINSLTGAINIVTKKTTENSLQAHAYIGSSFQGNEEKANRKYYGAGGQIGGTWYREKHNHLFAYNYQKSSGQRYNTASENNKLYYQGEYVPDSANQLNWAAGYIDNKFGANGFYAAPGDVESEEKVETVFAMISSKHQLTPRLAFSPRISNRYNEDDYRYYRHDFSKARSIHFNNAFSMELNGVYQTSFGDFGIGFESRWEKINSSNIGRHERNNQGAYAEFKTEQVQNLMINIGTYINYNSDYGWQLFPGIDLGYDVAPKWKLVFNAGSSQRIPSFTDLYLQQTGNIGNPSLLSEQAYQVESGVKYIDNNLIAQVGYFYRSIHDFIDWTRPEETVPYQPFNLGKNNVNGINTSLQYRIGDRQDINRYSINIGYNYLHPSTKKADQQIDSKYAIESLRHQAIANLTFQHRDWSITTANRFQERISYRAYFLSDIKLAYQLRNIHLYMDAQNIFDVSYIESGAVPMPGRWYSIGVKLNQVFRK